MEQMNISCKNCKYARQHYVIGYKGTFKKLDNSIDCIHSKVTKTQFKKNFKGKNVCQYWETHELKQQENEQKLRENLIMIYNRLGKVIELLESDAMNE